MITDKDLWKIIKKQKIPVNDIFMKDKPPNKIKANGYIINLQDTLNAEGIINNGTHWVALWFPRLPRQDIIYFDSFGFAIPQSLLNWIRMKSGIYKNSRIISNDTQIQDVDSGGCGIFCLFFIDFMNRHKHFNSIQGLDKFIKIWNIDTKYNLNLLKELSGYYAESV
jgi:hypothetical protein